MAAASDAVYEQVLVIRSQLGDESAFSELLERHGPRLLLFSESMLRSWPDEVPDVMQEIWLAIYRALPRLLDPAKFRPWAFRIARDRIYREYRRRRVVFQSLDESLIADVPEEGEPGAGLDREELELCLDRLAPQHREALVLRYFEEMNYEDIARVTGSNVGTVRSRIHYAKQTLQQVWKGKQYAPSVK